LRLSDLISIAMSNLWRRKLRTSLTILAVVIGATLVTLMVSLGTGLQSFIVDQFGLAVTQDALFVSSSQSFFNSQGNNPQEINITDIEEPFQKEDLEIIRAVDGVERIDFLIDVPAVYISSEESDKIYTVFANTAPAYEAELKQLVAGTHFAEDASGECLITYNYLEAFGWTDAESALGRGVTIAVGKIALYAPEIKEYNFTVVGVIQRTLNANEVLIPMSDAKEMARFYRSNPNIYTDEQPGSFLRVKVTDLAIIQQVSDEINSLGFNAITPNEILDEINSVFNIIQIALSAFGIIALVVATIGIINTLMMSIYERTREIGVMKAVGATKGTIRLLFTAEGGVLGFMGGLIGAVIALILGQLLNIIGSRTFLSDFPDFNMTVFPAWLILGIIGLTTVISLLAGLYPANRAARLDPVEALRYE